MNRSLEEYVEPAKNGDSKSFREVWKSVQGYVHPERFSDPTGMNDYQDFQQLARIGTLNGLKTFRLDKKCSVVSWCARCANQEMLREVGRVLAQKRLPSGGFLYPDAVSFYEEEGESVDVWAKIWVLRDCDMSEISNVGQEELLDTIIQNAKRSLSSIQSRRVTELIRFLFDHPSSSPAEIAANLEWSLPNVYIYLRKLKEILSKCKSL